MANTLTTRITFLRTAIFAVVSVGALFNSGVCRASCGEYVYSRFRTPAHHQSSVSKSLESNGQEVVKSELVRSALENGVSPEPPAVPVPCSGPNCSQNPTPSLPFAPPTTAGNASRDRLVHGRLAVELPCEVSLRRDLNSNARPLRGFPLLIEVPPETVG